MMSVVTHSLKKSKPKSSKEKKHQGTSQNGVEDCRQEIALELPQGEVLTKCVEMGFSDETASWKSFYVGR